MQRLGRKAIGGRIAVALLAAAFVIGGCGGVGQIDTGQAVERLNQQLNVRFNSDPAVAKAGAGMTISCPRLVQEGSTFDCTLEGKLSGEKATIPVEVRGDVIVPVSQAQLGKANAKVAKAEGLAAAKKAVDQAL